MICATAHKLVRGRLRQWHPRNTRSRYSVVSRWLTAWVIPGKYQRDRGASITPRRSRRDLTALISRLLIRSHHNRDRARVTDPVARIPVPGIPIAVMPIAVMPVGIVIAMIIMMIINPVRLRVLAER